VPLPSTKATRLSALAAVAVNAIKNTEAKALRMRIKIPLAESKKTYAKTLRSEYTKKPPLEQQKNTAVAPASITLVAVDIWPHPRRA
jgi:hypothetical protein